jgi:hypothetical protein
MFTRTKLALPPAAQNKLPQQAPAVMAIIQAAESNVVLTSPAPSPSAWRIA